MKTEDFMKISHAQAAMKASDISYENEQLLQRLSEADKVIKMAKEDLLTFSRTGKSEWAYEAIAAIEDYEKGKK